MRALMKFTGMLLLFAVAACGGCSGKSDTKKPVTSIQQLNDPAYTIAVSEAGAAFEAVKRDLPKAKRVHIEGQPAYDAVKMGKADACAYSRKQMEIAIANGLKGVRLLDGNIGEGTKISVGLSPASKIEELQGKINKFIAEVRASGVLDDMYKRWVIDGNRTMPDIALPSQSGIRLRVGTVGLIMPYNYYEGNTLTGYDIELSRRFAAWLGATLEFRTYDFSGVIAAAATGEIDCIMANLNITPERAEKINFSDVLFTEEVALMVRDSDSPAEPEHSSSISGFDGRRIGVATGTVHEGIVKEVLPKSEILYFDGYANEVMALASGKIDAIVDDEPIILMFEHENPSLRHIDGYLKNYSNAFILAKTPEADKIRSELDEFIRSINADGTLQKIRDVWLGNDDSAKTLPDYANYPDTNGTLRIATDNEAPPFVYIKDRKLAGYDVDIITRFCKAKGYRPEITSINFSSVLPAVQSGKSDVGIGAITITPERAESVNFTEPVYTGGAMLLVRKTEQDITADSSSGEEYFSTVSDLDGKRIGVTTGSMHADTVRELLPNAQVSFFDSTANLIGALTAGKIDAVARDDVISLAAERENPLIRHVEGYLGTIDNAFLLAKTPKADSLRNELNEFIRSLKADGTLQKIREVWINFDESVQIPPDYENCPATNGILKVAITSESTPFVYIKDGRLAGYEIDVITRFCKAQGYKPEFADMSFSSIIPAVMSGKYDVGLSGITITPERAESVNFTEPVYSGGGMLLVRKTERDMKAEQENHGIFSALRGKRIGVQTGVEPWAEAVRRKIPDARVVYYNTFTDMTAALKGRKIDAFVGDSPVISLIMSRNSEVTMFPELLGDSIDISVMLPKTGKGRALKAQWDEFITRFRNDGGLESLVRKWTGTDDNAKTMKDYSSLPATNGVLVMATEGEYEPFNYYRGTELAGLEVELAVKFCEAYGYGLNVKAVAYDGIFPAVAAGRYDFALDTFVSSDEHAENMLFSVPYYACATGIAVLKPEAPSSPAAPETPRAKYMKPADLAGTRIGVQTGTTNDKAAAKFIPGARIDYFDSFADIVTALRLGKIEAACLALNAARFMLLTNEDLAVLDKPLAELDAAPVFAKTEAGKRLCDQFNAFIKAQWENGTFQRMDSVWFGKDESKRTVKDYSNLPAPNGTLKMAVDTTLAPFAYVKDNRIVGYEVEMAVKFCEENGYGLEVVPMSFSAIIPAIASGKCDFASCTIAITAERAEQVLFASPNAKTGNVLVVRKSDTNSAPEAPASSSAPEPGFGSLEGKRVGVLTGTMHPGYVAKFVPTAKCEYFDSETDIFTALKAGKVDAVCTDIPMARFVIASDNSFVMLGDKLADMECSPVFAKTDKGRKLCDEFSAFIKACRDNGTLQEIDSIWLGDDDSRRVMKDYRNLPAPNGTLRMAVDLSIVPFTYMKNNMIVGYDVDCVARFCEAYGYGLAVVPMTFSAVIPAVASGKCDIAAGSITRTGERAEQVLFASPNLRSGIAFYVRKPGVRSRASAVDTLSGKRIGVQTGTTHPQIAAQFAPSAQLVYFDSTADVFTALRAGKIDAVCTNTPIARFVMIEDDRISMLGDELITMDCSPVFPKTEKGERLRAQVSEFVKACRIDGTLQEIDSVWFGHDDSKRTVKDYRNLPAPNGTLRMATDPSLVPFAYMKDNKIVGYDVDFAVRFCEKYGYGLEVVPMAFGALIPALQSGRCDFAECSIAYTPERAENVLYAESNLKSGYAFFVMNQETRTPRTSAKPRARFTGIDDLAGKRIGVQAGTRSPEVIKKFIPSAQLVYHDSPADNLLALKTGKLDAISLAEHTARVMMADNKDIAFLGHRLTNVDMSPIFPKTDKGRRLQEEYSEFVRSLWEDGTIRQIDSVWLGNDESKKAVKDYTNLPAPNGTLRMAVDTSMIPFVYVKDNKIVGYDIDIAVRFCEAKGYGLKVVPMVFPAIIPAVSTSKCDFSCSLTRSPERAEVVSFSPVPNASSGTYIVVRKSDTETVPPGRYSSVAELAGKRIGVQTGSISQQIVSEAVPTAKQVYIEGYTDQIIALKTGKIDAFCTGLMAAKYLMAGDDSITYIDEMLSQMEAAPIFPKTEAGEKLCAQFSEFFKKLETDGTLKNLLDVWFGRDDSKKVVKDYTQLPAPNGVLKMATDPSIPPLMYIKDNKIVGYDLDCAVRFCEAYGYGLEIVSMSFPGIIPALMSGKCDFAASAVAVTDERKENVLFSFPNMKDGHVFVVMKQPETPAVKGTYTSIAEMAGKRIGVQTGMANDTVINARIPSARAEYFESLSDMLMAMRSGRIDAVSCALSSAKHMMLENDDITVIPENLEDFDMASMFPKTEKGERLCKEYSEFIKTLWEDGTIQKLGRMWMDSLEGNPDIEDYTKLPATNGTLKMAVDSTVPFVYVKDNRETGYDIDIAVRFCRAKGYGLEVVPMNFGGMLAGVQSGKYDFSRSVFITKEREETALFSFPTVHSGNVLVVMKEDIQPKISGQYTRIDEMSGRKIGVQTGTMNAQIVAKNIPTAHVEYFDSLPDALIALKTGKVDALCCSIFATRHMMLDNGDITYINHMLTDVDLAPIFTSSDKGRSLAQEYGEFMKGLWNDGTIAKIDSLWLGKDESRKVLDDYTKLPATNGTLRMAVDPSAIPFTYMKDGKVTGYDIDLAVRFCKARGYGLELVPMSFSAILPAVQSGKCDFSSCMTYTPERAQIVLYSPTPNARSGNVIVVRKVSTQPEQPNMTGKYTRLSDLAGHTVGIILGANHDTFASEKIPDVKIEYFQDLSTITLALQNGKIDAFANTLPTAIYMTHSHKDISYISEPLEITNTYSAFTDSEKGREICAGYAEFIKSLWEDGTVKRLADKWIYGEDESLRTLEDYSALPAPNGVLKMAIDTGRMPFAYVKDNKIIGYDIELAAMFCKAKGYGLEVYSMDFAGILGSIKTGKCDLTGSITRTEERAETMLFSPVPNAETPIVLLVMKAEVPQSAPQASRPSPDIAKEKNEPSFFDELAASFNRTFIREERWRLFAEGIMNTMIITVLSILCGTALGFVVYLFCRGGNVIANFITRFFVWLIQGTPMVVLLMILYYIIFGKVDIEGIWVAVIAFSMTFGAGVYGMLCSGVNALDRGQTEAAYALGFTDRRTFFTVILPQAALHFMPAYKGEVVALIKATAIVGYIAVQDLTKMGDIVRSRTYEAFFPLIAVAVIYFVLAGILNVIVGIIHNRIRPEKRSRKDILRGIDTHD